MNSTLTPYRGRLTAAQIADGMNAAARNARRLLADAECLFDAGRFPSSLSLATLAIEEAGKLPILREISVARSDREIDELWRRYRSHREKNRMWPFLDLVANGSERLWDFAHLFARDAEHPRVLDTLKQIGLYTDCYSQGHWAIPSDLIDQDLARGLIKSASALMPTREISEDEIVLWQEHLGPVWGGPLHTVEAALLRWFRTMAERGLVDTSLDRIERFLQRLT